MDIFGFLPELLRGAPAEPAPLPGHRRRRRPGPPNHGPGQSLQPLHYCQPEPQAEKKNGRTLTFGPRTLSQAERVAHL